MENKGERDEKEIEERANNKLPLATHFGGISGLALARPYRNFMITNWDLSSAIDGSNDPDSVSPIHCIVQGWAKEWSLGCVNIAS